MKKIIFTWDDNFHRHYSRVAPLFEKKGIRCTFYVNPGWRSFEDKYLKGYKHLSDIGFEIGSHGLFHKDLTKLSFTEYEWQLKQSKILLESYLKKPVYTFAFPHHKFSAEMLEIAKKHYIETRNTIPNSIRYSLKTELDINNALETSSEILNDNKILVFSGHNIVINKNELIAKKSTIGYEPILLSDLEILLEKLVDAYGTEIFTTVANVSNVKGNNYE